jgi:hypothetical protein
MTLPPVSIGQSVTKKAFTDCFGVHSPAVTGLTVDAVRLIEGVSLPDYWRIKASAEGKGSWEGAFDRFFTLERGPKTLRHERRCSLNRKSTP